MFAFAVQKTNFSHGLLQAGVDVSLSIPGPSLLDVAVVAGTHSGRDIDKLKLLSQETNLDANGIPWFADSLSAISGTVKQVITTGDHSLAVMIVNEFVAGRKHQEQPLLSVGRDLRGYKLLKRVKQHRFAIAAG